MRQAILNFKTFILPCIILAAIGFQRCAYADSVDGWCANYISDSQQGLHRITIHRDHADVKIHVVATGFPDDLDWGDSIAEVYPSKDAGSPMHFIARFKIGDNNAEVVISPNTGGATAQAGGLIGMETYIKNSKGTPISYFGANFRTPDRL
jgi:hypothetical protein